MPAAPKAEAQRKKVRSLMRHFPCLALRLSSMIMIKPTKFQKTYNATQGGKETCINHTNFFYVLSFATHDKRHLQFNEDIAEKAG